MKILTIALYHGNMTYTGTSQCDTKFTVSPDPLRVKVSSKGQGHELEIK
jgi:hypothetical protein